MGKRDVGIAKAALGIVTPKDEKFQDPDPDLLDRNGKPLYNTRQGLVTEEERLALYRKIEAGYADRHPAKEKWTYTGDYSEANVGTPQPETGRGRNDPIEYNDDDRRAAGATGLFFGLVLLVVIVIAVSFLMKGF